MPIVFLQSPCLLHIHQMQTRVFSKREMEDKRKGQVNRNFNTFFRPPEAKKEMVAKQKASPALAYCLLTTKTKTTLTNKNNQKND